ncbi:hypothetical protein ACN28E_07745 [Archangium lansingense]|uniref:hypothetical protein n=1 Tax=Archangium lansingense TaxID=2995310 RepID=UPI003B7DCEB2
MNKRAWIWVGLTALTAVIGGCSHVEKINGKIKGINSGMSQVTKGVDKINTTFQSGTPTEEQQTPSEEEPEEKTLPAPQD